MIVAFGLDCRIPCHSKTQGVGVNFSQRRPANVASPMEGDSRYEAAWPSG